ncbi:unnamed protein product [Coffea canephora]|uniref:DEK-C domain-containing protein n=1 Tax=Coffea canephora TaxID=49390 RepID=A0A068UVC3_COFCA|nr:unnamed protein product [Coffea canephora]
MDSETEKRIEETVLEILRNSNMDEATEYMIRQSASEKLGLDLSYPPRKKFVRQVVNSYLTEQNAKAAAEHQQQQNDAEEEEEEEDDDEEDEDSDKKKRKAGDKEYDDEGDLIICRLSKSRRVTLTEFRGRTLVSIREYYSKGGKDLPTSKGISLTAEQWASFSKNVPAIEKAIKKMKSRLD